MRHKLLIIDDEENMRHMLTAMLSRSGYQIELAANGEDALEMVEKDDYDFILCDIRMPVMDGLEFLKKAREYLGNSTVIMMSAYGSIDIAIEAMQIGAYDFISKPFKADEVLLTLKKAEEREMLKTENLNLKKELEEVRERESLDGMVGNSEPMVKVFELAKRVAKYDTSVLIMGESGTGKELVARAIHNASPRSGKNMVSVNCASIPENLLESEFFGYTKGAFTGADREKKGLFQIADQSTLFLDEVGELPLGLQVKFLRVLQERELRQLGSNETKKIDVRVIAATAKNLNREVEKKLFRQDLLYRLNVVEIVIPPLRQRVGDMPRLVKHFIKKYKEKINPTVEGVDQETLMLFDNYLWPGNVRELENAIEHALVCADGRLIHPGNLPLKLQNAGNERSAISGFSSYSIKEGKEKLEKHLIEMALTNSGGNRSKASELLEVSYPSLLSKIKHYQIDIKNLIAD